MLTADTIKTELESLLPGAGLTLLANDAPGADKSILVPVSAVRQVAETLRDDPRYRFDYASNVTGVDWPEVVVKEKLKIKKLVDGVEKEVEEVIERKQGGYLEVVYHLFSMEKKHGPVVIRVRTTNRSDACSVPSLTPVWRSAEFQEREIFDLYGVVFEGHPDLRRILMWDGFKDFPMRKDYQEPDDYEYEPTPHDDVLEKARKHYSASAKS